MPKRRKIKYWSEPGRRAAEEFAYESPVSKEMKEHVLRDEQELLAAFSGRDDCQQLSWCLKRLMTNIKNCGFFDGFGTGFGIAQERFSRKKPSVRDSMIIDLYKEHPYAGPTEMCDIIDEENIRTKDKNDKRDKSDEKDKNEPIIYFPYPALKTVDEVHVWAEHAKVKKVKQLLNDLKRTAWRRLYASQFDEPHFLSPAESAKRDSERESSKHKSSKRKLIEK
jgi:hypothetical protein